MKKIISVLLVCIFCISFVSCKKETEKPADGYVVSYNGVGVSETFFRSQVINYKISYLYGKGFTDDAIDIWTAESNEPGMTLSQAIVQYSLEECAAMAWVVDYALKNGISVTDEDKNNIEEDLATLESMYQSREDYLAYLGSLGYTEEKMKEDAEFNLLYERGMKLVTSNSGPYKISDNIIDSYFEENYIAVKHIWVNNVYEFDDSGNAVDISDETLEVKSNKISSIQKALEDGGDFDTLYSLSDDAMHLEYPDGVIMSSGDTAVVAYEDAALALDMGEWTKLEIDGMGTFFILRVELPKDQISEKKEEVSEKLWTNVLELIWNEYRDDFLIDKDYTDSLDVASLPIN